MRSCSTHSCDRSRNRCQKRGTDSQGVRLPEHDGDANFSCLTLSDDSLFISGSLKYTTTMPDDRTTAATAYGFQIHPTTTPQQKSSPTRNEKTQKKARSQFKGSTSRFHRQTEKSNTSANSSHTKTQSKSSSTTALNARGQHSRATDKC